MKTCSKCRQSKPFDAFSKDAQKADGLRLWCRQCVSLKNAEYRANNLAAIRDRLAAWHAANPERAAASRAAWRARNPELVYAIEQRWKAEHRESRTATDGRRRADRSEAPGDGVTSAQWKAVLTDSLGLCVYCNERKPLTMDHVDPLARGGAHDVSNVVAACKPCNSSKHNSSIVVWLARRRAA